MLGVKYYKKENILVVKGKIIFWFGHWKFEMTTMYFLTKVWTCKIQTQPTHTTYT